MTRVLPLERLTERSAENPSGVLFRDFTMTVAPHQREDGSPVDGAIEIAISSEAPVLRYDWRTGTEYLEVLDHAPGSIDLSYVADGIPFCLDHWLSKQIGIGETVSVGEDRKLRAVVRRGSHPDAAWVFADMANGVRKKVSVGYDPGDAYIETKGEGDEYATRRYTRWMPYEASSVAVPADYGVGVGRSAAGALLSTEAAPTARNPESVMTDEEKAALARGNAATVDTSADLRAEQRAIAALAKQHGRESDLAGWVMDGLSLEQVRDKILNDYTRADANKPQINSGAVASGVRDRAEDKPWAEDGADFFRAVVAAGRGGEVEPRLRAQRAQNTVIGEDGGFAVPQSVVNMLLNATMTDGEILSRVTDRPVSVGNTYTETLVKEEARTAGSRNGGVRGYWLAEDGTYTESQSATRQVDLKLQKLGALVKLTEEQIEDGPALVSFINEQVPEELRFVAEQAIWEGDGAGKPLGAMSSGALVTVAIEATQTIANTNQFIWRNAAKMYSRMAARARRNAAWFINDELWANILTATAGSSAGAVPMFIPPGQLQQFPNGAIYGRPVAPIEYASAEGTPGDFVFADFSDYLFIGKGGIKQSTSMHVDFARDRQALKFTWRVNGAPRTKSPVTPFKGSATKSPYIALATRS